MKIKEKDIGKQQNVLHTVILNTMGEGDNENEQKEKKIMKQTKKKCKEREKEKKTTNEETI